jgi:hypothetical protein
MGTPNKDIWPGVELLSDFKPSFPNWVRHPIETVVQNLKLEKDGLDLLNVQLF